MKIVAFTTDQVKRLTGLSVRQIRYWDDTNFFQPTLIEGQTHRAFGRVYSFRDVVGLKTIAVLRKSHGLSLQELRKVGEWLRSKHATPWSSLRLALSGRRVAYFDHATTSFRETRTGEQAIIEVTLEPIAHEVEADTARMSERQDNEIGRVARNRYVVHNAWVVAGTRIPIRAIVSLSDAGYSPEQIIQEYPRLTRADVASAILHWPKPQRAA